MSLSRRLRLPLVTGLRSGGRTDAGGDGATMISVGRAIGSRDHGPRAKRVALTPELIGLISMHYKAGDSIREVATRCGVSYGGARNALLASGTPIRAKGPGTYRRNDAVRRATP